MDSIWNYWSFWILVVLIGLIYKYTRWEKEYFTKRGVKGVEFPIPFIGSVATYFTTKEHSIDGIMRWYNTYPDQKYIGLMQFGQPSLLIKDLDMLKRTMIKDFDHFTDTFGGFEEGVDPLFSNILFNMKGGKWRDMRATLSPVFTSSKMRNMFQLIDEMARQMTTYYLEQMKQSEHRERGLVEIEMRDAFSRYTLDGIATCVFGIKINSFTDSDSEFHRHASHMSDFTGIRMIRYMILSCAPKFSKMIGLEWISPESAQFFRNLVLGNMRERKEKNIIRHDVIDLLMEAQKGSLKHDTKDDDRDAGFATVEESDVGKQASERIWTSDEIVAQAVLFFSAGFDTTSTVLCFLFHELTINPDVQKKLQQEIDAIVSKYGHNLKYDHLREMKYMDMVVSETLRLWPPGIIVARACTKPYDLPPPSENSPIYKLNIGDSIIIPIYAFHRDPQYFPNPTKFYPERFSDENRDQINSSAFMPFGTGPRNCIGSRFALAEIKSVIFQLLSKFDFVQTAKTENPIVLTKLTFVLKAENGFWIGLKPR